MILEMTETHSGMNIEINETVQAISLADSQHADVNVIHLFILIISVVFWIAILYTFVLKFLEWTDRMFNK